MTLHAYILSGMKQAASWLSMGRMGPAGLVLWTHYIRKCGPNEGFRIKVVTLLIRWKVTAMQCANGINCKFQVISLASSNQHANQSHRLRLD